MSVIKNDCVTELLQAGVSPEVARQTVDLMMARKQALAAQGKLTRGEADLVVATRAEFDEARARLAMRRRQAALNVLRRLELETFAAQTMADGFSFLDAVEAKMIGFSKSMAGAKQSVAARQSAIFNEFRGQFFSETERLGESFGIGRDGLLNLAAKDPQFAMNFARERMAPGSTKDAKARAMAELYGRLSEHIRQRLNQAGANIDYLEGQLPQSHDQIKLLDKTLGGRQGWMEFTEGLLDTERAFPCKTREQVREILDGIYDIIATGKDLKVGDAPVRITPRNIAFGLGKRWILRFKDADAFMAYRERYGRGNLFDAIFAEIEMASKRLGLMEIFGANPEHVIRSLLDAEKKRVRAAVKDGDLDAAAGKKQEKALNKAFSQGQYSTGKVARWLAVLTGETQQPGDVGLAKAWAMARSVQSMTKLGAATLPAMADGLTKAMAIRVDGANFLEIVSRPILDYARTNEGREQEIARELGLLIESQNGAMLHRFDQTDTSPGRTSAMLNTYFKYSGLNFITEQSKAGFAMRLSNHLGRARGFSFGDLSAPMRAMLEYHGFGPKKWELMRKHMVEGAADNRYLNPSLARNLTDTQIAGLLPERLRDETPGEDFTPEEWADARTREFDRIRVDLENEARAFFVDEIKFAVIEPDAKSTPSKNTAAMSQGSEPGAKDSEALLAIMQLKSFPLAFWLRTVSGRRWQRGDGKGFDSLGVAEYAAFSLANGYLAMTLKDISKNRTPRAPKKAKTWFAAVLQSGGAGIYGDFVLGKVNSFGTSLMETMDGPTRSEAGEVMKAESMDPRSEPEQGRDQLIRSAMGNAPSINLWYTRAALDYMFLDNIKEWMSPGYKRRMLRNMREEDGQAPLIAW